MKHKTREDQRGEKRREEKRREKTRREKKQDKRRDKMKRERERWRKDNFFQKKKNVSRPSNPPDELAHNVSKKKSLSDELFLHFSFESAESGRFELFT